MKKELINMHLHTSSSDGQFDAKTLLKMIENTNLKIISFTDHDTVAAYKEIEKLNLEALTFINGCEFSAHPFTDTYRSRLHILGYDMDLQNPNLLSLLEKKRENNEYNFLLQLYLLKKQYKISFPKEEINRILSKDDFGRPDIALLLVKYGHTKSIEESFQRYLVKIFEDSKNLRRKTEAEEIFETIKKANGYISIAHIISNLFNKQEMNDFLTLCKNYQVDALELYHPNHDMYYRELLLKKINEYDFLISGGTDYHGPDIKPERLLENDTIQNIKIKQLSLCTEILNRKIKN